MFTQRFCQQHDEIWVILIIPNMLGRAKFLGLQTHYEVVNRSSTNLSRWIFTYKRWFSLVIGHSHFKDRLVSIFSLSGTFNEDEKSPHANINITLHTTDTQRIYHGQNRFHRIDLYTWDDTMMILLEEIFSLWMNGVIACSYEQDTTHMKIPLRKWANRISTSSCDDYLLSCRYPLCTYQHFTDYTNTKMRNIYLHPRGHVNNVLYLWRCEHYFWWLTNDEDGKNRSEILGHSFHSVLYTPT